MKNLKLLALLLILGATALSGQNYIVLGWNDLGMHCANKDFSLIAILPPANNFMAQVIKVGDKNNSPEIVTNGVTVEYSIPGNTYSVGKTNFWTYVEKLFGVKLPDNIGLKNFGLSGNMSAKSGYFIAEAIPVTPYQDNDLVNEAPYQNCKLVLKDTQKNIKATTMNVIPVSNEISCVSSGCHKSEQEILNIHPDEGGFDKTKTPILCASCHGSNALGLPGHSSMKSLSFRIHNQHKSVTDCYKCHPGKNAKCFRDVMMSAGKKCTDCHGTVANVASTINSGRRPWLDEPKCGDSKCHGSNYAEEPGKLFRESKSHHGVYCSACHGSPHAIVPTVEENDNYQNKAIQGFEGKLKKCTTCHGYIPSGHGPHNIVADIPQKPVPISPANDSTGVPLVYKLIWTASTNSDNYEVEISLNADMSASTINQANTTSQNINSIPETKYYWRVRGSNDFGWGEWSQIFNFSTHKTNDVREELISELRLIPYADFSGLQIIIRSEYLSLTDLRIIDLNGFVVKNIISRGMISADYNDNADISDLNSGIYFVVLRKGYSTRVEKLVIKR